jgi:hypothetical protein
LDKSIKNSNSPIPTDLWICSLISFNYNIIIIHL